MKRNARQSFHVSASRAAGSAVLPVIPLLTAVLDRERKDFSLSLEMTMREGGILPPSPGRRCPEGAEAGSLNGMKRNGAALSVSSSRAQPRDLFRFLFSVQACIIKKNLYMLFLCVP